MAELDIFVQADRDYNGRLTFLELTQYAQSKNKPNMVQEWFSKFDKDQKGYITVQDIEKVLNKPPPKDYTDHVGARSLAKQAIQGGTTKYRSEQLEEKGKSMPYFFSARENQFMAKGQAQGDSRELCRQGRLEVCDRTHHILFDKQTIGELDVQLRFTRVQVDRQSGNVYIDGLNHGSMADMFFCDLLILGHSREPYEVAVVYSTKHDLLFINGHCLGKMDQLYKSRKFTFSEPDGILYYSNIPIGLCPAGKFDKMKHEDGKVSFNGSKAQTPNEHVKGGTLVMHRPGYVKNLGYFNVNPHTTEIALNDKPLGKLSELLISQDVKIQQDRLITYKNVPVGCLDDQLPAGTYTYQKSDRRLHCNEMPVGQLDDMLERRQICLAGTARGRPRLHFTEGSNDLLLDSVYLKDFKSICQAKSLRLDVTSQCIYYDDVELARMPDNWRDYNVNTVSGGFVSPDEKVEKFQELYFNSKLVSKPTKGGSLRRVVISSNTREVFLDGQLMGRVDELLEADRLKVNFRERRLMLDDSEIAPLCGNYLKSDEIDQLKQHPEVFVRLFNYGSSTFLEGDAVFENGAHLGKLAEVVKTDRLKYDPKLGLFRLEEDPIAYATVADRTKVTLDSKKQTVNIEGREKSLADAIQQGQVYVHTSPYDLGMHDLKIYDNSLLDVNQPVADLRQLVKQQDQRLKFDAETGTYQFNGKYLVHQPDTVLEKVSATTTEPILKQIFQDANRQLFIDETPIILAQPDKPAGVHAAPPTQAPLAPAKKGGIAYFINADKKTLEADGKELGQLKDLIAKGDVNVNLFNSALMYKNDRVCMISPMYWHHCPEPAKLTAEQAVALYYTLRYDMGNKQFYKAGQQQGKLPEKLSKKLLHRGPNNQLMLEKDFLTLLPPAHRHFDFRFDGEVLVEVGPAAEAYLEAMTNQRYVHHEPRKDHFIKQRAIWMKPDGVLFERNGTKICTFDEALKSQLLSYRPRSRTLMLEERLICSFDGDLSRYALSFDEKTFTLKSCNQEEVKKAAQKLDPDRLVAPYLVDANMFYTPGESLDLRQALAKKQLTVDLPTGELRYKGNQFCGTWPMDYAGFGVTVDPSSGQIACKTHHQEFINAYQRGQQEHFGGLFDMDHSTGMVYLRDHPMGTLLDMVNRGRVYLDPLRHIVTMNGHYFCSLVPVYQLMGLDCNLKSGQVSAQDAGLVTLIHRCAASCRSVTCPALFHYNKSGQTVHTALDGYKPVKLADFVKQVTVDERVMMHNGVFLAFRPDPTHQAKHGFDTDKDKLVMKDLNKFSDFLGESLLDWRMMRLSGEVRPNQVTYDAAKSELIYDQKTRLPLKSLMQQRRVWFDQAKGQLLADGCLVGFPDSHLMYPPNAQCDATYWNVTSISQPFEHYVATREQLDKRKSLLIHYSCLDYLTKQSRLTFDDKLGIIYFDKQRVGYLHPNIADNMYQVRAPEAAIFVNNKSVGTVEECFSKGLVIFEYEFLKASESFRESKNLLLAKSPYGPEYHTLKENKAIAFYDPSKTQPGMNIIMKPGQKVPKDIMEFVIGEVKRHDANSLEKDLAKNLKQKLDQNYGRVWQVIASKTTIGCKVSHFEDMFINLEHQGITYIVFRTPDYN